VPVKAKVLVAEPPVRFSKPANPMLPALPELLPLMVQVVAALGPISVSVVAALPTREPMLLKVPPIAVA